MKILVCQFKVNLISGRRLGPVSQMSRGVGEDANCHIFKSIEDQILADTHYSSQITFCQVKMKDKI